MTEVPVEREILKDEADWMNWLMPRMEKYVSSQASRKDIFNEVVAILVAQMQVDPKSCVKNFETAIASFKLSVPFPADIAVSDARRVLEANKSSEGKSLLSEKVAAAQDARDSISRAS